MTADTKHAGAAEPDPMQLFSGCHARIHQHLGMLHALADTLDENEPSPATARTAEAIVRFFENTVHNHHREEEHELWPMLERAGTDTDIETFKAVASRLKIEHRQLEALWDTVAPSLSRVARGKVARIDSARLAELVQSYERHTEFEDAVVTPMANFLLSPSEQTRLSMAIALRRMPAGLRAYL